MDDNLNMLLLFYRIIWLAKAKRKKVPGSGRAKVKGGH
jgi:hypothetical protein